ncbi:hypothetical protein TRVL_07333 [Trypanosoma vivax]|uniref:Uncharacterized protein n=1 Tax=Trypanosoma vivax (strain Y486) TaxID=1055687 RepID=G0U566_TRYVY|nr:hypothetical protein TRVL_07333 [Trypanosoma vivax]CCC51014.1 conserved hypothetical protein [Trypanosoma vivax Y486]
MKYVTPYSTTLPSQAFRYILVLCVVLASWGGARVPVASAKRFRCLRSFSSLPRLTSTAIKSMSSCNFTAFEVLNANARTSCKATASQDNGARSASVTLCSVTVNVVLRLPSGSRRELVTTSDEYRYSFHLRALNNSMVHYRGFNKNGFSLCCNFLQGTRCSWEATHNASVRNESRQRHGGAPSKNESEVADVNATATPPGEPAVLSCPMYTKSSRHEYVNGTVTKPLHQLVSGSWEVRVEFWHYANAERTGLGRVLLPFHLHKHEILSSSRSAVSHLTAGAMIMTADERRGDL